jgi:hypothetical protein
MARLSIHIFTLIVSYLVSTTQVLQVLTLHSRKFECLGYLFIVIVVPIKWQLDQRDFRTV